MFLSVDRRPKIVLTNIGKNVTTATIRTRGVIPNPNQIANSGAIARIGVTFTRMAIGITVFSTREKRDANTPKKTAAEIPTTYHNAASRAE